MTMSDENDNPVRHPHSGWWKDPGVAGSYDRRRFTSFGGSLYDRMEKRRLTLALGLAERQAPIRRVLDLACGTGRISEFLTQRGYAVVAADISAAMLETARARLAGAEPGARFLLTDIYAPALREETFDCVTAVRLFQHLTSAERALVLTRLARLTRRFVIVNVMYTSLYYGLVRRARRVLGRYTTLHTSSRAEIARETAAAGLAVRASLLTQPLFNGNMVLLLERER